MGLFSFLRKKKDRKKVQEVNEVQSAGEVKQGAAKLTTPTIEPNIVSSQPASINEQKPVVVPVDNKAKEPGKSKQPQKTSQPQKAKPAEEEKPKSTKPPKYHVSQNKDQKSESFRKWRVRKEGSQKTIKFFDTQKEAIAYAEDLAGNNKASVVVHKLDGSIRKQNY